MVYILASIISGVCFIWLVYSLIKYLISFYNFTNNICDKVSNIYSLSKISDKTKWVSVTQIFTFDNVTLKWVTMVLFTFVQFRFVPKWVEFYSHLRRSEQAYICQSCMTSECVWIGGQYCDRRDTKKTRNDSLYRKNEENLIEKCNLKILDEIWP